MRFLPLGADLSGQVSGSYRFDLVALSIIVASLAAFTALLIEEMLSTSSSPAQHRAWLAAGAVSMGCGIWCMHFLGMLAFQLPFPVHYDPLITLVSLLPGIAASGIALHFISRRDISFGRANLGGILMGGGIGVMHYTGMAAMLMPADMAYAPVTFALSLVVAHVLATASIFVKFTLQRLEWNNPLPSRIIGGVLMGLAVAGMHYTGMASAHYFPVAGAPAAVAGIGLRELGFFVLLGTVLLIALTIAAVYVSKRLRRASLTIERLVESAPDAIVTVDPEGRICLVNLQTERLFGYDRREILGKPVEVLVPERLRERHDDHRADYAARPRTRSMAIDLPLFCRRKDGSEFPAEISLSYEKTERGLFVTSLIRDVTDRLQMQTRMRQSEKLSAVGQLAAGVAHEINNPLGVILGFAQGMAHGLKAGDPLELPIRSIERESLRCKTLVQDLLTFARTSKSEKEPLEFNPAVEQAVALAAAQAKMSRVKVETALEPGLPRILGNKNQIQQIVVNLAKNAIDAMPDGGTLTVRTRLQPASPQAWVRLEVADTGTGIPPDLKQRIFEPFFTTKPVGQGTGLGLSLVNEIVRKHSGDLEVESGPGGTTFIVRFPAKDPAAPR
ncbi:MAG: PAS domain S-box protein [Elusimicrobia bacterium]|nr:PAS domain S-box protein [Elusimicrobiota bacterium]